MGTAAKMGLLLFGALLVLGIVGAGAAVAAYSQLSKGLPPPQKLETIVLPEQSIVWDREHKVELARFGEFNREVVAFEDIPPVLVDATTAIEDASFWENAGFDPIGIVAAGIDSLRGRPRGASTITQQLVRQRLLTNDSTAVTELSASRKLKEIIQSIRVTQAFEGAEGKQRIMAAYLNQNYYGNESYGVAAAAKGYFGKELKDLTLAEAAIIAAIPQAPSAYDLVRNAEEQCVDPTEPEDECTKTQLVVPEETRIVQRRNQVLDQMSRGRTPLTKDQFTDADFEAAKAEPVIVAPQKSTQWKANHFVWQVREELTAKLCRGEETCTEIEEGGLDITSTLDWRMQRIAEKWVKAAAIVPHAKDPEAAAEAIKIRYQPWMENLRDKKLRNGALIAQDYQTGDIVAYVGSADANATKATKRFQPRFDVLADGWRQPGSAFKPIVYGTGIAGKQITAGTMFMDVVTDFGDGYTPTDADNLERGPVRVRDALRFSLNIPAVKAMATIGNDNVQTQAEAMGIQFRNGEVDAGLSFALGVEEVHPKDLVRAYGVLADRGRLVEQTTLLKVTDSAGETVVGVETRPEPEQVMDEGAAGIVTDILAGNTDPQENPFWGEFRIRDGDERRPATLKTGTNNDARDLNAYGYIAAPSREERSNGEYALAVGRVERQLGQLARQHARPAAVLDRGLDLRLARLPPGRDRGLEHQRVPPARGAGDGPGRPVDRAAVAAGREVRRGDLHRRHRAVRLRPRRRALRRGGDRHGRRRVLPRRLDALQQRLAQARRARGGRPRRTGEHPDRVLLQRAVQPVRPLLGAARRRQRVRVGEPERVTVARPVRVGRSAGVGRSRRRRGASGRRLVPAAVRIAVRVAERGADRHAAADRGTDPAADRGADAAADRGADARRRPSPRRSHRPSRPHPPRRSGCAAPRSRRVGAVRGVRRSPGEHSTPAARRIRGDRPGFGPIPPRRVSYAHHGSGIGVLAPESSAITLTRRAYEHRRGHSGTDNAYQVSMWRRHGVQRSPGEHWAGAARR